MRFQDRREAGQKLAAALHGRVGPAAIVVALPRGGVPVGYEIARALHAPLDVLIARKLGAPGRGEFAIGALAQGGGFYLSPDAASVPGVTGEYLEQVIQRELAEIERRLSVYRGQRPPLNVFGRTAIVVDDGLATGATMRAAIRALRMQEPACLWMAVPVCALETAPDLRREVDDVTCLWGPARFDAVGEWYDDFSQTSDQEVIALLERTWREYQADAPLAAAGWGVDLPTPEG
jgi:predicted phosphoribosyltransferase